MMLLETDAAAPAAAGNPRGGPGARAAARRDPQFRRLPFAARILVALTLAGALAGTAAAAAAVPAGEVDLALLVLTAVLSFVAAFFQVGGPGTSSQHPGFVFVFWGAIALPPVFLPLLAALCFVGSAVVRRARWYKAAFYTSACVVAGLAARAAASPAGLPDSPGDGPVAVLALGAAAIVFVLVVDVLRGLLARIAWHRPLGVAARGLAANFPLDVALTSTGAALAVLWSVEPWLCAILAGPLVALSRALLVPALRHKSRTDPKTGLFNFEHLRHTLDETLRTAGRRDEPVALVMVDLDHLRAINNRFGHLAGDEAILRVAGALGRAAHDRGLAARFGGEEFCLLLPGWSAPAAEAIVDGVRVQVGDLKWGEGEQEMCCSFSAGVAEFPQDGEDAEALLAAADAALYDAKAGGRNRVRLALPEEERAAAVEPLPSVLAGLPPAPVAAPPAAPVAAADPADAGEVEDDEISPGRPELIPALIAVLLAGVAGVLILSPPLDALHSPLLLAALVGAVVALDVVRIDLFEGLNLSAASVPTLTLAALFGPAGPIAAEVAIAVVRWLRGEPRLKWSFDLGALGLAGAAAAAVFAAMPDETPLQVVFAGIPAALAYYVVNVSLMSVVISLSQGGHPLAIWRESMAWLWAHYIVYGVLGAGLAVADTELGHFSIAVFVLPIIALWLGQKQYVDRSRASVVELRRSRDELEVANRRLHRLLDEKRDLLGRVHGSYLSTIASLARTIESRDPYTGGHTERVARVTTMLAGELGLPAAQLRAAEVGAAIHDIGKVGVPDEILLKPDRLTEEEAQVMRRHPEISSYIVGELDVPPVVKEMVRNHHERFDGTGYPDKLAGEEIPLSARILAVADTLDAMTSDRPYRPAMSLDVARHEITDLAGRQFCPTVVAALVKLLERDPTLGGLYAGPVPSTT